MKVAQVCVSQIHSQNCIHADRLPQLYVYPIKSLRPTSPRSAEITYRGFQYDRAFMLINPNAKKPNMHVSEYARMCLFLTEIVYPTGSTSGKVIVTFREPGEEKQQEIEIPLQPDTAGLEVVDVSMHESPCKGYDMGQEYNAWFTKCFGFPVKLLYLGENRRKVRGNISPTYLPESNGWLSSISSNIAYYTGTTAVDQGISFADCAPFLVVSLKSLEDVDKTLPDDDKMLIEKFRPNIVLEGADEAWEEDFWSDLAISTVDGKALRMHFTANCARCTSLNVDFKTGRPGLKESGSILKKLSKYRRVDPGAKYSPIFGRYGFMMSMEEASRMNVGDEVKVSKRNTERTTWCRFFPLMKRVFLTS